MLVLVPGGQQDSRTPSLLVAAEQESSGLETQGANAQQLSTILCKQPLGPMYPKL